MPAVGLDEYEAFVQRVWRDVSAIEYIEERPRVRVGAINIDFARISCVISIRGCPWFVSVGVALRFAISYKREVTRTLEVVNVGKVCRSLLPEPKPVITEVHPQVPCSFRFVPQGPAADICKVPPASLGPFTEWASARKSSPMAAHRARHGSRLISAQWRLSWTDFNNECRGSSFLVRRLT